MRTYIFSLLEKNIISIDIGTFSIKIVEGNYNMNTVQINKMLTIPTPLEAFDNGEIIDKEKIEDAINEILKKENIKTRNTTFTLESMDIISREIVLPWTKPQDLEKIIRFEAEQCLPIKVDDYILQYKIIDKFEEENIKRVSILVVALPKSISKNYLDLGKSLTLNPYYLDVHSNAVHKLLSSKKTVVNESYPLGEQTIAAIDLGHKFINIIIINRGQFEFSRLLNIGGIDIDASIANLFGLPQEEAEAKKKRIKNINHDIKQDITAALTNAVKETVTDWLEEIQKIFVYYKSRNASNTIDSICIHGGSSNIEGISTYIQGFFNMPTFKINSLNNIKFNNHLEETTISGHINAIGAIIRR